MEGVKGVAGGRCNRPPPDPLSHLPIPPPRALALAATRPRGSVGTGKGALASRQCATGGAPQKGAPARTRGRGTGRRDRTPPPVRLPTPRPEGGETSLPLAAAPLTAAGRLLQRPVWRKGHRISKPLNPASRGSLTAEPNGATRRGGEDCEAGRERWNCGGGLAPPSNHRPGALRVDTWCSTSHPVYVCICATETPPLAHSMSQEALLAAPRLFPNPLLHKRARGWLISHVWRPPPKGLKAFLLQRSRWGE